MPMIIARTLGINWKTDVFFFAFAFIMFFTLGIASTLEAVLVPFLVGSSLNNKNLFINSLLTWCTALLSFLLLLAYFLLIPATLLLTKFNLSQIILLKQLYWESIPLVFIIIYNSIYSAIIVANRYFLEVSFSAISRALSIVISLIFFIPKIGIYALPLSLLFGETVKLIFLLYYSRTKCKFYNKLEYKINPKFKEFIKIGTFQFLSVIIVSFNPIVDKTLATWLKSGSLTIIEYSEKIYLMPVTLLSVGISMVILPRWAEKFNKSDSFTLKSEIKNGTLIILIISVLIVIPLILFAKDIVGLLYGNKISLIELKSISLNTIFYLIGVPFYVVSLIQIRALVASKRTKALLIISAIRLLLNIVLDILLIYYLGIYGITIATSINSMILILILSASLKNIFNKYKVEYVIN